MSNIFSVLGVLEYGVFNFRTKDGHNKLQSINYIICMRMVCNMYICIHSIIIYINYSMIALNYTYISLLSLTL